MVKVTRKFNLSKDLGETYRYETVDIEIEHADTETALILIEEAYRLFLMRIREGKIR